MQKEMCGMFEEERQGPPRPLKPRGKGFHPLHPGRRMGYTFLTNNARQAGEETGVSSWEKASFAALPGAVVDD